MSSNTTEYKSHKKEYFIVFLVLTVLTIIEIVIPELEGISKMTKGSSLILLAFGKAFVVAYFYMHLKEETKWMKFIAAVPVSAFIYGLVVILESLFR